MIKTTLRIALTPATLIVRLLLGLTAFITFHRFLDPRFDRIPVCPLVLG